MKIQCLELWQVSNKNIKLIIVEGGRCEATKCLAVLWVAIPTRGNIFLYFQLNFAAYHAISRTMIPKIRKVLEILIKKPSPYYPINLTVVL